MRVSRFLCLLVASAALSACAGLGSRRPQVFTFDEDVVGAPSSAFESRLTGPGRPGAWIVIIDPTAPSGRHVLAQTDADATEKRFPHAVLRGPPTADVRIRAKCRAVSGRVDQACGLLVRWQGPDDYYVARANALEGNVRLYRFVNGVRTQIAGWDGAISGGEWHDFALEARGDRLRVDWDGRTVIDQADSTISSAGRAGLWTKADSVTEFDDVEVSAN